MRVTVPRLLAHGKLLTLSRYDKKAAFHCRFFVPENRRFP
jgi:hypothetical protein